jgi:hypothetical protein
MACHAGGRSVRGIVRRELALKALRERALFGSERRAGNSPRARIGLSLDGSLPQPGIYMTVKFVRGHPILETVAPSCHLVGQLRRDTRFPNRLILTRTSDALSPEVRALTGRSLQTLKVTDPIGKSATMSNVSFIDTKPIQSQAIGSTLQPSSFSEHDSNSLEDVSFTFQSIAVENLLTSTSTSDGVLDWPPPRHRHDIFSKPIGSVCP